MRRVLWTILVGSALFGGTACSLLFDPDGVEGARGPGLADGGRAASDLDGAGSGDVAAPTRDATTEEGGGAADAGNLVPNAGFETGIGTCGAGWTAYGGTISGSTIARSGGFACRFCGTGWIDTGGDQVQSSTVGDSYYLEAWVRKAPDGGAPPEALVGIEFNAPGDDATGSPAAISFDWTKVSATIPIREGAGSKRLRMFVSPVGDGCILVDDVVMQKQ